MDPVSDLRFDPDDGSVIRQPMGAGYGYWVGGHKVSHDPRTGLFALFYRQRAPLEAGRGGLCRVALGFDGVHFDDVWEADKSDLDANSIEVGHCLRHDDDEWRLYVSYEVAGTSTWRVDLISADHPANFEAQHRRTVLSPGDYGIDWIKDPWVVRSDDGGYDLYAAVPSRVGPTDDGVTIHAGPNDETVVARSVDGVYFPTLERIFTPPGDDSWHGRRGRLNSLIEVDGQTYGTFDGGRTMYDNYEEWCGLVHRSADDTLSRIDTGGPWVRSPHGSVRYVWGLVVEATLFWYYEYTRSDGSHDLRVSAVELPASGSAPT